MLTFFFLSFLNVYIYVQGVITKNGNDAFDIRSFAQKMTGN